MGFVQQGSDYYNLSPPQTLTINGVTAGNTLIVGVGRASSAARNYNVVSDLDGSFTEYVNTTTILGGGFTQCIFALENVSAGNHSIEITQVSGSAQVSHAVVIEVSGLDDLSTTVVDAFIEYGSATNNHYSAQVGNIDFSPASFVFCFGWLNGTNSGISAGPDFTGLTLSQPTRQLAQYKETIAGESDQRGEWSNSGTSREGYAVIAAFPLASAGGQTLEFSGSIPLPELDVTLTASAELQFSGSIPLPELSAQLNSTLQLSFNGSIPLPEFAALLDANANLNAALSIPLPSLSAVLSQVNTETLVFDGSIPLPAFNAALAAQADLSGSLSIPLPSISASLLNGAPDNFQALYKLWNFRARLDVKLEIDSGNIEADEFDVGGTFVAFNKAFKDINSITVSALSTTEIVAIYDFVDVPNPTGFYVYAFDTAGSRVTATVSWKARGVL